MDDSYLELQDRFEELLGNQNVYFEPPPGTHMKFPCIRFKRASFDPRWANNNVYIMNQMYEAILIYKTPNSPLPMKMAQQPLCSHIRQYTADNLTHDVYHIYLKGGNQNGKT